MDVDHLLVLGLDEEHERTLRRLRGADRCEFHPLFAREEVRGVEEFSVDEWLTEARRRIEKLDPPPAGIINFWDFPVAEMAAILAAEYGFRLGSLDSLVRVQHKYTARVLQQLAVPEAVPLFEAVDVYDDDAVAEISLPFPFWLKPVRSFRSHLAFRVRSKRELAHAVQLLREGLPRLADPYDQLLAQASFTGPVEPPSGRWCVAEAVLAGRQCTLEGWSAGGEVVVYGAVDSVRSGNRSSFARYRYPSTLPAPVLERMAGVVTRLVEAAGMTDNAFNAEFFWDRRNDRIRLLEVNARCSQSHFDIFELVDGLSNAQVLLDLALGRRPEMPHGQGSWPMAAKCFIRAFDDAVVTDAASPAKVASIEAAVPGVSIHLEAGPGERLSEMADQDQYSYELGHVIVGGNNDRDILAKFRECRTRLGIELRGVAA